MAGVGIQVDRLFTAGQREQRNGRKQQTVDVATTLGLPAGLSPVTAVSVTSGPAGSVVLTFGAQTPTASQGSWVAAIDVGAAAGAPLWHYKVADNATRKAPTGQFPVLVNATGARRIVFRGTTGDTFFIGEP